MISNHQSLFDIVAYLKYFGGKKTRFVAKDTLGSVPMVGKMLKTQGHCMIPRHGSPSVAMSSIDSFASRVLQKKQIPVIFPEGTRTRDGNVGQFYAAGMAAHLAGVIAGHTTLPVIGVPCGSAKLDGMDALLSTVQMPSGIPVATVAIDGAKNAAVLAVEILALSDEELSAKLEKFRADGTAAALKKDAAINNK